MSNISVEVIGSHKQLGELCTIAKSREALQLRFKLLVWSCMVSEFHTSCSGFKSLEFQRMFAVRSSMSQYVSSAHWTTKNEPAEGLTKAHRRCPILYSAHHQVGATETMALQLGCTASNRQKRSKTDEQERTCSKLKMLKTLKMLKVIQTYNQIISNHIPQSRSIGACSGSATQCVLTACSSTCFKSLEFQRMFAVRSSMSQYVSSAHWTTKKEPAEGLTKAHRRCPILYPAHHQVGSTQTMALQHHQVGSTEPMALQLGCTASSRQKRSKTDEQERTFSKLKMLKTLKMLKVIKTYNQIISNHILQSRSIGAWSGSATQCVHWKLHPMGIAMRMGSGGRQEQLTTKEKNIVRPVLVCGCKGVGSPVHPPHSTGINPPHTTGGRGEIYVQYSIHCICSIRHIHNIDIEHHIYIYIYTIIYIIYTIHIIVLYYIDPSPYGGRGGQGHWVIYIYI